MTDAEIQEHINWLLTIIGNIRSALTVLSTGRAQSYTLDTGQTRQTVTKKDMASLRAQLNGYLEDLDTYRGKLLGCGTIIARHA
jgi:hypothetical protein